MSGYSGTIGYIQGIGGGGSGSGGNTPTTTVTVSTTANIDITSAPATADLYTLQAGNTILVTSQAPNTGSGHRDDLIYTFSAAGSPLTLATGFTTWQSYIGLQVAVLNGTQNGGKTFISNAQVGGVIGTTSLLWASTANGAVTTTGEIQKVGNVISLKQYTSGSGQAVTGVDTSGNLSSSQLQLNDLGGTTSIAKGGTGQTTATNALNALLPSQTGNSGKVAGTDGVNVSWVTVSGAGTVSSVSATGTNGVNASVTNPTTTPAIAVSLNPAYSPTFAGLTLTNGQINDNFGNSFTMSTIANSTSIVSSTAPASQFVNGVSNVGGLQFAGVNFSDVAGVNTIAKGGTNSGTALNNNSLMYSNGGKIVELGNATNGQIAIGSTSNAPVLATLTGTANQVNITNGAGNITLSLPQSIATTSTPTFAQGTISNAPTNTTDIANKAYVDAVAAGLSPKQSCQVATLTNITLSGLQTIDGYTTLAGDRVIVKNQTNNIQNGIYLAYPSTWIRTADFNTGTNQTGAYAFVENGSQENTAWICTSAAGVGSSPVTFVQFAGSGGSYTAGTGLTLTGSVFSLNQATPTALGGVIPDNNNLVINGSSYLTTAQPITTASTPTFADVTLTANTNQILLGTSNTQTITMATQTASHVMTLPNANSNTIQPLSSATPNQFVKFVDSTGTQQLGTYALGTCSDVAIINKTDAQLLQYSSTLSDWTNTTMSGDATINNTGVLTIGTNAVTNTKLAQMATNTIKGNNTGATANALDLTSTQVTAMLNDFVGDSGTGGTKGLTPAPASGDSSAGKFLKADGTWSVPSGSGSGTVTSVSVVTANGLAGTVATATTLPAITLSTTITGLLKGDGTAISSATAGTDYLAPALTSANLFVGNTSNVATGVALSGDATIDNSGVLTVSKSSNLKAGSTGQLVYQVSANNTSFVPNGTTGQLLQSAGSGVPSWTTPTSTPTSNSVIKFDANSNLSANNLLEGFTTTVTSSSPVTLSVTSTGIQQFTGSTAQSLTLPDATTLVKGTQYLLQNVSTATITIYYFGGTALTTLTQGNDTLLTLSTNVTTAGTWHIGASGGLSASLTSGNIYVGNSSNIATSTAITGDVTLSNTGVTAIGNNIVTNNKLNTAGANTYKGNSTGSTANITDVATNTAFNQNFETSTANIQMDGIASVGTLSTIARADHTHPTDTSRQAQITTTGLLKGAGAGSISTAIASDIVTVLGATSNPTASTTVLWDASKNLNANNLINSVTSTATAAGTTTLTVASTGIQRFTGTTTQTLVLPSATTLNTGTQYFFQNESTGAVTIKTNGGATLLTIPATSDNAITLNNNGTAAGTWHIGVVSTGGGGTVTSVSVANANGLSGTVANPTTTPAITLAIGNNAIANNQLAIMPTMTVKGNSTGGTANPTDITFANLATAITALPVATFTASATLSSQAQLALFTFPNSNPYTCTLPTASGLTGLSIVVQNSSQNNSTLTVFGGVINYTLSTLQVAICWSNGSQWVITTSAATNVLTNALPSSQLFIGNAGNIATATTMSGDVTITNAGVTTIANNAVTGAKIATNTIDFNKTIQINNNTILGNNSGATGNIMQLSPSQIATMLGVQSITSVATFTGSTTLTTAQTYSQFTITANATCTLPAPSACPNQFFYIENMGPNAQGYTPSTPGALVSVVNAAVTFSVNLFPGKTVLVFSDGTNWNNILDNNDIISTVTANGTLTTAFTICNATSAITMNLPAAGGYQGRTFKVYNNSAFNVSVNNAISAIVIPQFQACVVESTGVTWAILSSPSSMIPVPNFSVYASTSYTTATVTVVPVFFQTKEYDVSNCFNNTNATVTLNGLSVPPYAFCPNVAGYYQINGGLSTNLAGITTATYLYKNGSLYKQGAVINDLAPVCTTVSSIVYLNGIGDYVQLGMSSGAIGAVIPSGMAFCWFNGSYLSNGVVGNSNATPTGVWTTYTPVITGSITNPTYAGCYVYASYSVVGKIMYLNFNFTNTGVSGMTAGSGNYQINMPSGYTINTTIAPSSSSTYSFNDGATIGSGSVIHSNNYPSNVIIKSNGNSFLQFLIIGAYGVQYWNSSFYQFTNGNLIMSFTAQIPIN